MKKSVLFVSSNETLVLFVSMIIKRMGFEIETARSGHETVELLASMRPDAVIIESEMAEFDGLHKLEFIKEYGSVMPPVIMLVGALSGEAVKRCIRAGVSTVIFKPVIADELQNALQECMYKGFGVRRKHVRAKTDLRVKVFYEGRELSLITESLSAGGAYIRHDEPLEVGTVVDIFIPIRKQEYLFVTGKVIYNQKPCQDLSGLCPGFAVRFESIGELETESIREYALALLTGDKSGLQDEVNQEPDAASGHDDSRSAAEVYSAIHTYTGRPVMRKKNAA